MESCYEARKENELAVLIEYISREKIDPPDATFLDIILYSREQIILENVAMGSQVFILFILLCLQYTIKKIWKLDPFSISCTY